jgi:hypothetical protein
MPCQYIIDNRTCKIPTKHDYCHVHNRAKPEKIKAQKQEITILNKRLSEAMRKLDIIDRCDHIKYQLAPLSRFCSFRFAITNPHNKAAIERIFNAPQEQCLSIYNDLIEKRNILTHRYTSKTWSRETNKKKMHGRTIQSLIQSLPNECL